MDANNKIAPAAVTIYHNPRCSNSRAVLALLQEKGVQPQVVEYLKTPLNRAELQALVAATGLPLRDLLRSKEAVFAELGLGDALASDAQLLAAVAEHPVLLLSRTLRPAALPVRAANAVAADERSASALAVVEVAAETRSLVA